MISSEETCASVEAAFGALLSGEATREEIRRANHHLASCARCRAEFDDLAGFRRRWYAAYGISAPLRRRFAGIAGLAMAASLVIGLAVSRLPGDWREVVETPVSPAVEMASAAETPFNDDDIWIELLSDEEIEDMMIAALAP